MIETDVAIVGAGPGGAATAIYLAREGVKSVIIEKERFPRYHIGESLTGEVGQRLNDLGLGEYLATANHPRKFGVNVFGPQGQHTFRVPVMKRIDENTLQAAQTWQVPRDSFDQRLLEEALSNGAQYIEGKAEDVLQDASGVRGLSVRLATGEDMQINSKVVVDASGPACFLHSAGVTSKRYRGAYSKQVAVYSQLERGSLDEGEERDNTLIFYQRRNHWAWYIPLSDNTVSIGVVVPSEYFTSCNESLEDFFTREVHQVNPELKRRTPTLKLIEKVRATSNYSYAIDQYVGNGFLCVGDSHRFIDPIFSFGLHLALHEGERAARTIAQQLKSNSKDHTPAFAEYQRICNIGMDSIQELVDAFWNNPHAFAYAAHYKYTDDIVDLFAGRIYEEKPSAGLLALRAINDKHREKMHATT